MVSGYSSRYKGRPGKRGSLKKGGQQLKLGGWFWKLSGCIIIGATLVGLAGSCWFSWNIKRGLDGLAGEQEKQAELQKLHTGLEDQKDRLFARKRIEKIAADKLGLYPADEHKLGGGLIVRVPRK